jgi:ABC-type multidrug transport system ATPase subunit
MRPKVGAETEGSGRAAVSLEDVTCRFGRVVALDAVSLEVPEGCVFGLIGPNGAGKSTLVDVITDVLRPTSGRATVLGLDVRRSGAAVRARIGVVPQETALYDELTVEQNLRFAADLYGVRRPAESIARSLGVVGLTERRRDVVRTLSGGMRRRAAIARALIHDPALLILDEPTLGVDVEARHQIWMEVRALRAQGRTVVLTTNYLDEAEALCDRLAILRAGRLVAEDTPAALTARLGRCLDLDCEPESAAVLESRLGSRPGVLRVETSASGVTLYLNGRSDAEALVREAMATVALAGFRNRAPDLAELIRSLPAPER